MRKLEALSASASSDNENRIHLWVYNLDPDKEAELLCLIRSAELSTMTESVLTAYAINAHTPSERLDVVWLVPFQGAQLDGDTLSTQLPPKSVLMLEIS